MVSVLALENCIVGHSGQFPDSCLRVIGLFQRSFGFCGNGIITLAPAAPFLRRFFRRARPSS